MSMLECCRVLIRIVRIPISNVVFETEDIVLLREITESLYLSLIPLFEIKMSI